MEPRKIIAFDKEITGTYLKISQEIIRDIDVKNKVASGCRYEEVVFENVSFISCDFQSTDFTNVEFIDCHFKNCDFSFSKLSDCNWIACKIENCDFLITNSLNCSFLSCTYLENIWKASSTNGSFFNCYIAEEEKSSMDITLTHKTISLSSLEFCVA